MTSSPINLFDEYRIDQELNLIEDDVRADILCEQTEQACLDVY